MTVEPAPFELRIIANSKTHVADHETLAQAQRRTWIAAYRAAHAKPMKCAVMGSPGVQCPWCEFCGGNEHHLDRHICSAHPELFSKTPHANARPKRITHHES